MTLFVTIRSILNVPLQAQRNGHQEAKERLEALNERLNPRTKSVLRPRKWDENEHARISVRYSPTFPIPSINVAAEPTVDKPEPVPAVEPIAGRKFTVRNRAPRVADPNAVHWGPETA